MGKETSLARLCQYDDFLTDILVDAVSSPPGTSGSFTIRTTPRRTDQTTETNARDRSFTGPRSAR